MSEKHFIEEKSFEATEAAWEKYRKGQDVSNSELALIRRQYDRFKKLHDIFLNSELTGKIITMESNRLDDIISRRKTQ